jgi:hypothetical protein
MPQKTDIRAKNAEKADIDAKGRISMPKPYFS